MSELSHVDREGRAHMVDVSAKAETARTATAAGMLRTTPEVVALVRADDLPKADVLATARVAGIAGAKKTSELIPLCHPLALTSVRVAFEFLADGIGIEATAKTTGPTGVEMEALTAVAVAGLTLHDMVKAVDPAAVLDGVRLLTKSGGKRGEWSREAAAPADDVAGHVHADSPAGIAEPPGAPARSAVVLVASTGVAAGTREDRTGPVLADWLTRLGFDVRGPLVYADADIALGLADALRFEPELVLSTGGTGASPTDATPEATLALLTRELPGIGEAIRRHGAAKFPLASLSRGVAGLVGRSVVVNLPGSPGGVRDGITVLEPLLDHLLAQVAGGGAHEE
ncbi:bifunctional molybdenum cofactor biosynthesis protein MoaC/MoaB [Nocardia harenae]|uniref:bifunctional molybdenum cofactor biosynthesis protein MoaC/MoaB n=1 Tax=Nocardia harenae TaxID=358707 RepID=UPI000830575E|nr:bifunctional molybdenum cofactor biosynthesis protein MoaC/MoaB [Nocardia harenae]